MAIFVRNDGNARIYFALSYHFPNCPDGDNWAKKGWCRFHQAAPRLCAEAPRTAHGTSGTPRPIAGLQWAGDIFTWLPTTAFDWCWPTSSSNASPRGMRPLDVPESSILPPLATPTEAQTCSSQHLESGRGCGSAASQFIAPSCCLDLLVYLMLTQPLLAWISSIVPHEQGQ